MGSSQFKDEQDIIDDYYVTIPIPQELKYKEASNVEEEDYPVYTILF